VSYEKKVFEIEKKNYGKRLSKQRNWFSE